MQPISEERRQVAERLHGLDAEITRHDTLEIAVDKFIKAVHGEQPFSPIGPRLYSVLSLCGLGHVLAAYIDPTCHVVGTISYEWQNGSITYEHELSCGHTCCTDWPEPSRYCQYCGARVVSE